MSTISPAVTVLDDTPLYERMRAVSCPAGQSPAVAWTMVDGAGHPVDLTPFSAPNVGDPADPLVVMRVREAALGAAGTAEFAGTVAAAASGLVSIALDNAKLAGPGVHDAEVVVNGPDGAPALTNRFYLVMERSLFGGSNPAGPPTVAEIRLHLRDSSPAENRLLDGVKFDLAEIAACIEKPVLYWNEIPPPIRTFGTDAFPFRYHWLEGIAAQLLFMAAEWYRTNSLQYSAAGVQVADMEKSQECRAEAVRRWQEFKDWARSKKVSINASGFVGAVNSSYGRTAGVMFGN